MNKTFWKTYFGDKEHLRFKLRFFVCLVIITAGVAAGMIFCHKTPLFALPVILGYIIFDPFSYYFIIYLPDQRRKQAQDKLIQTMTTKMPEINKEKKSWL